MLSFNPRKLLVLLSTGSAANVFAAATKQEEQFNIPPLSIPFMSVHSPYIGKINAAGTSATGLDNRGDIQYVAKVQIGSKTFNINLDTGSADTWIQVAQIPGFAVPTAKTS